MLMHSEDADKLSPAKIRFLLKCYGQPVQSTDLAKGGTAADLDAHNFWTKRGSVYTGPRGTVDVTWWGKRDVYAILTAVELYHGEGLDI